MRDVMWIKHEVPYSRNPAAIFAYHEELMPKGAVCCNFAFHSKMFQLSSCDQIQADKILKCVSLLSSSGCYGGQQIHSQIDSDLTFLIYL